MAGLGPQPAAGLGVIGWDGVGSEGEREAERERQREREREEARERAGAAAK